MIAGIIDIKGIKKVLGSTTNIIWERPVANNIIAAKNVSAGEWNSNERLILWNHAVNHTYYIVEHRLTGDTAWLQSGQLAAGATSYIQGNTPRGINYDFRVVAYNAAGQSAASTYVSHPIPRQLELGVNILTPTEGQEITGDLNITFEIINDTGVSILSPTEGEEITGDLNITFEII